MLTLKYEIENDPDYVRNLYKAYKLAREKKYVSARHEAAAKALKLKNEKKDVKKGEESNVKGNIVESKPPLPQPTSTANQKGEKTLTIDEFIQKGYLLKALDLPAEGCNTLLTTLLPEDDIPVVPEDRSEVAQVQRALKKVTPRASNKESLSHQDRID